MAAPGTIIWVGLLVSTFFASLSMAPHSGVGACTPSPRNDSVEILMMAQPTSKDASTARSEAMDGTRCRPRMNRSGVPMQRENRTKFRSLYCMTPVRIIRAYQAHLMNTLARITFWTLMPKRATTANTMIWLGNESITSTVRMIISSTAPRKYPAKSPIRAPSPMVPSMVRSASPSVGRMPYIILDRMHLPRLSVPSGYWAVKPANLFKMSVLYGSLGASTGAKIPASPVSKTMPSVIMAVLLCKSRSSISTHPPF